MSPPPPPGPPPCNEIKHQVVNDFLITITTLRYVRTLYKSTVMKKKGLYKNLKVGSFFTFLILPQVQ